jgi:ATP-dependent Clp protease protease subunit
MTYNLIPMVVEQDGRGERSWDLASRMMKERIIFLNGEVNDHMAQVACMQILYLESVDPKAPINVYINSPGGSCLAGMAIEDTLNAVSCPVATIASGMAMSMGAYLLSCGTKGMRSATEGCRIMCHMVSSGMGRSTVADMKISMRETEYIDEYLAARLAANCGQPLEKYKKDIDRDFFMSTEEAKAYGLIDHIVPRKK